MLQKIGEIIGGTVVTAIVGLVTVAIIALVVGGTAMSVAVLVTGIKFLMSAIAL
ncbi:hypothetical protein GHU05_07095 [Fructobacillus tropaeoli]|uniref:hypothetical protein n=1 Tax=Fructobacillus tropaeoli TaxID=709323 RepID=UPI001455EC6D|nr:hypothetical protein [Fructobacillus tropaeoli]NLS38685.1 hypothetical protein [Fructobacillus tropaeoli]